MSRRPRWRWDPFPFFTISGIAHPGEIITCNTGCTNSTRLVRVVSNLTFFWNIEFLLGSQESAWWIPRKFKSQICCEKNQNIFQWHRGESLKIPSVSCWRAALTRTFSKPANARSVRRRYQREQISNADKCFLNPRSFIFQLRPIFNNFRWNQNESSTDQKWLLFYSNRLNQFDKSCTIWISAARNPTRETPSPPAWLL